MSQPFLFTKQILPLLEAALAADYARLGELEKAHAGAAKTLAPVTSAIKEGNQRLFEVASAGIASMGEAVDILIKNAKFAKEITDIMDHATTVASAVEEMAASATEVANTAQQTAERARESNEKSIKGNEGISSLMGDMDLLENAVKSMAQGVEQFVGFTSEINKLTAIVKDIAHQTNLLALNAAIEAARAGEAGRGFAVVADEVKKLADKTAEATSEIENVTNTMNALSSQVGEAVNTSLERLTQSIDALEVVATSLADGTSVVRDVSERIQQIAHSAEEQKRVAQQMAASLTSITESLRNESAQVVAIGGHTHAMTQAFMKQFNTLSQWGHDRLLLEVVKADHFMWKVKLADMLFGHAALDESELKDHTQCRLGKWYYSIGKQRYGASGAFRDMEEPHAQIHALGREVARLAKAGDLEQATAKLEEMDALSERLIELIERLEQELTG